jgi:hypothetical protein
MYMTWVQLLTSYILHVPVSSNVYDLNRLNNKYNIMGNPFFLKQNLEHKCYFPFTNSERVIDFTINNIQTFKSHP